MCKLMILTNRLLVQFYFYVDDELSDSTLDISHLCKIMVCQQYAWVWIRLTIKALLQEV